MSAYSLASSGTPVRIPAAMEQRLAQIVEDGPDAIDRRLESLDNTWTAGRAAKASAGVAAIAGTILGLAVHPGFFALPVVAGMVFLQYLFGRRMTILTQLFQSFGFPTGQDIEEEKIALRALRGDFRHLPTVHQIVDRDSLDRLEGEGGIVPDDDEVKLCPREAVQEVLVAARSNIIRREML